MISVALEATIAKAKAWFYLGSVQLLLMGNQKENYIRGSSDRSAPASRRRIPAAPFLSNTSRTPPASIARRIAIKLLSRSLCSPLSNAAIARSETFACLASSICDHLSQPRAARHCSGVMDPDRKEILCCLSILLELGRYTLYTLICPLSAYYRNHGWRPSKPQCGSAMYPDRTRRTCDGEAGGPHVKDRAGRTVK